MDSRNKEIENLKDYKYGFSTDIENIRAPKGLNEDVIKFISNIKNEPKTNNSIFMEEKPAPRGIDRDSLFELMDEYHKLRHPPPPVESSGGYSQYLMMLMPLLVKIIMKYPTLDSFGGGVNVSELKTKDVFDVMTENPS